MGITTINIINELASIGKQYLQEHPKPTNNILFKNYKEQTPACRLQRLAERDWMNDDDLFRELQEIFRGKRKYTDLFRSACDVLEKYFPNLSNLVNNEIQRFALEGIHTVDMKVMYLLAFKQLYKLRGYEKVHELQEREPGCAP